MHPMWLAGTTRCMGQLQFLINYIIWSIPSMLLAMLLMGGRQYFLWKWKQQKISWPHEIGIYLLTGYLGFLFSVTWDIGELWVSVFYGWPLPVPHWFQGGVSILPIHEMVSLWDGWMLVGNIILFCPLGILIPLFWKRDKAAQVLQMGIILSLFLECVQFVIGRTFDVGDLLSNTVGTGVGWMIWYVVQKCIPGGLAHFRVG